MATGLAVGGDVEQALNSVGVPSYVLDTTGVVRWINPAAERLLGAVRGRHFSSIVAPEASRRARAVPLMNGERVVGVVGLLEGRPDDTHAGPHPHLTPRQAEVLRRLEQGR